MYHIFCIHSSVEGHMGYFLILDIINKAVTKIVEQVSLLYVGTSFGYMSMSGVAGSPGPMFNFLRNSRVISRVFVPACIPSSNK